MFSKISYIRLNQKYKKESVERSENFTLTLQRSIQIK